MVVTDVSGRSLSVDAPRRRLVSLVPSTTETLFALGVGDNVVGVTRFCVHPAEARKKARIVGGTKTPSIDKILALEPDLVLANQEENRREDIESLQERVDVYLAFPKNVREAASDIRSLGALVGERERGNALATGIETAARTLRSQARDYRFLYLIWRNPYMAAGPGTFVDGLLGESGGRNALPPGGARYPEMTAEQIAASSADVLLLSSEPFPFRETHREELAAALSDQDRWHGRILLVDGELLSWHGVRLLQGIPYLAALAQRMDGLLRTS